jgi:hypothetical protein
MNSMYVISSYTLWHYTEALKRMFGIWTNFLWFFYNFFSIPVLLKTLFAPFERLHESRTRKFDLEDALSTFAVNITMRLVGAVMRLAIITAGIITIAASVIAGIVAYIIWLLLPLIVFYLLGRGLLYLA